MCIPPGTESVPAFARVRDWWAEERGSKPWRPSYVLRESAENWSALDASGAQVDASSCDRAARLCATGINLPLQALHVASTAYENTNAFDPEHPSTPPRDAGLERRGSLSLVSGGPLYLPLEVASVEARRTNQEQQGCAAWQEQQMFLNPDVYMKNEVPVIAAGVEIGAPLKRTDFELPIPKFDDKPVADLEKPELGLCEGQPGLRTLLQQPSGAPELESIGSFAAWLDCITKNDTEMEERSLSEERCTEISFEAETKHVKKAPKLTKTEKKNQKTAAAAVHSHEETEDDMCTDDDTEPVLIDEKRKRRMLSNRASAQRSRQRRQDRLDQLEVLTAQLRVENASLLRKSNLAVQLARKFEGENKKLQEKENYLSKEVLAARKPAKPKLHEDCHSSPNTCTDISEIVGEEDLSPEVELNLEKVPDDWKKPTKSTVSKSYMTVDDQMDMENTSKDTDMMTADCSNEKAEKCKTVQVSEVQGAARKVKWDIHRSPVSCKTSSKNTEGFSLPTSLPQANLLSPVKEVPVTIPDLDSRYLLDEISNLFESDSANDPYINNDILNMMDQNWLESFAECLNA